MKSVRRDAAGDTSRSGPLPADAASPSALGPPDVGVLGDIAHEMGNHLHKVYYWTDYLREQLSGRGDPESAAIDHLAGAVERLDVFMRMILEYFAPARMCFSKVRAADLVGGLSRRLPGRQVVIDSYGETEDVVVYADAGLLAHAIRTVFERVASTLVAETELHVVMSVTTRRQYRGVEIEFVGGASAKPDVLRAGIEMSVAEKFLQMHGAELLDRDGPPCGLAIFIPVYG